MQVTVFRPTSIIMLVELKERLKALQVYYTVYNCVPGYKVRKT